MIPGLLPGGGAGLTGGTDTGSATSGGTYQIGGVTIGPTGATPMTIAVVAIVAVVVALLLRR